MINHGLKHCIYGAAAKAQDDADTRSRIANHALASIGSGTVLVAPSRVEGLPVGGAPDGTEESPGPTDLGRGLDEPARIGLARLVARWEPDGPMFGEHWEIGCQARRSN